MIKKKLLVLGAGDFACIVAQTAADLGYEIAGFVVDEEFYQPGRTFMNLWVRSVEGIRRIFDPELHGFVVGIVSPLRVWLVDRMAGYQPTPVIHPTAHVDKLAHVRYGSFVNVGAVIDRRAILDIGAIVNRGATVGHHAVVHACATVGPGANLAGHVSVGKSAIIGIGANVLEGRKIGVGAIVGAGSVVTRDVPPGEVWFGNPAKFQRKVKG